MNITFLIGNGFDLALGLHTDYKRFLNHYINLPSNDKLIIDFKKQIKKDIEIQNEDSNDENLTKIDNWADLELAFGKYTEILNTEDGIVKIYNDVLEEIKTYIEREEQTIDFKLCQEELTEKIIFDLKNFYSELKPEKFTDFQNKNNVKGKQETIFINFISFNYTSCIEKCLNSLNLENGTLLDNRNIGGKDYSTRINHIKYIHGSIKDNRMLFGLNDESQVLFKGEKSEKLLRKIVKPIKNRNLGYGTDKEVSTIISTSTIICIFGMSLGDTDKIWWEKIGNWLKTNNNAQLLLFHYDEDFSERKLSAINEDFRIDKEEEYKVLFKEQAKININDETKVDNKIYPLINSNLFQINLKEMTNNKLKKTMTLEEIEDKLKSI